MIRLPFRLTVALAFMLGAAAPSFAVPVTSIHAEELVAMAPDVRKTLALNANQQTLWGQVDSRSHAILRARAARRESLQRQAGSVVTTTAPELRTLGAALDAEDATVQAENRQLRELWLTMNDALDEQQRLLVARFIGEQLERVEGGPMRSSEPKERDGGDKRPRGGARGGIGNSTNSANGPNGGLNIGGGIGQ